MAAGSAKAETSRNRHRKLFVRGAANVIPPASMRWCMQSQFSVCGTCRHKSNQNAIDMVGGSGYAPGAGSAWGYTCHCWIRTEAWEKAPRTDVVSRPRLCIAASKYLLDWDQPMEPYKTCNYDVRHREPLSKLPEALICVKISRWTSVNHAL